MTLISVDTIKHMRETAAASGVAPNFARYMDNPYLGLSSVIMNAANEKNNQDTFNTLQKELDALNKYMASTEKTTEENASIAG